LASLGKDSLKEKEKRYLLDLLGICDLKKLKYHKLASISIFCCSRNGYHAYRKHKGPEQSRK
jgi:hypothetical protein